VIGRPAGVDDSYVATAVRVYVKLLRATKAVVARVEPRVADSGLTVTQLGVLEALLHLGPLSQRELGRKVLTSAGNMTDVIDKLQRRGLVVRSRRAGDRRTVRVALTVEGQSAIQALFPYHAYDIAAAMNGLEPEELRQLDFLLRKLGLAASVRVAQAAEPSHVPSQPFAIER
jgi:MarR family transcriptional regulator, 2-MHQ and catechol-resistance regulon repressor